MKVSLANLDAPPPRDLAGRIWARDASAWGPGDDDPAQRLGWLDLPVSMQTHVERLTEFAAGVRAEGISTVVLLGMGGSSLAPEVFARTLGSSDGRPRLEIADSTHPGFVADLTDRLNVERSLFVVSSKSGGTIETMSLFRHFRALARSGANFVAITDPGTSLETLAREEGFRATFVNPPDIGGRFSALSLFGLVPAALLGIPLDSLLDAAAAVAAACRADVDPSLNPGLVLGTAVAGAARQGRDKLTFLLPAALAPLGMWLEQLIAESTGKGGKGVTPIADEPTVDASRYGDDRVFCTLAGGGEHEQLVTELAHRGHPIVRVEGPAADSVAGQMFLWEFATAVAGSLFEINAFDQPDVEAAKRAARKLLDEGNGWQWPDEDPEVLFSRVVVPELTALLVFAPPSREADAVIEAARRKLLLRHGTATTAGYGPRYLHSTGQLHKGGPGPLRALVVLDPPHADVPVPGETYGFADLVTAQAGGDAAALEAAGRSVARTTWETFRRWALL